MFNHISKVTSHIYFGKYVDADVEHELYKAHIDVILDLTHPTDNLPPYNTDIFRLDYPIVDMSVTSDKSLVDLIPIIAKLVKADQRIYIHCKGGHGRSATLAACLYGYLYKKTSDNALSRVYIAHQERKIMRPLWRKIGAPQTSTQIEQVKRYLRKF